MVSRNLSDSQAVGSSLEEEAKSYMPSFRGCTIGALFFEDVAHKKMLSIRRVSDSSLSFVLATRNNIGAGCRGAS